MRPDGASVVLGPFASTTTVAPFGTRQGATSLAGANPGFTENHIDLRVGDTRAMGSPVSAFSTGKTQDEFPLHIV